MTAEPFPTDWTTAVVQVRIPMTPSMRRPWRNEPRQSSLQRMSKF
jgi:hypothetical protein